MNRHLNRLADQLEEAEGKIQRKQAELLYKMYLQKVGSMGEVAQEKIKKYSKKFSNFRQAVSQSDKLKVGTSFTLQCLINISPPTIIVFEIFFPPGPS